jgi:hypothetical protein
MKREQAANGRLFILLSVRQRMRRRIEGRSGDRKDASAI